MYDFEFNKPATIAEAVEALADEDAQALGGGQTLLPTMKQRLAAPERLVSLTGIAEMRGVCEDDVGRICIGGGTTHAAVAQAVAGSFPGLASLAARIGDPAVRSRGTIGGSLANNDPSACYPAAVLGTGAVVRTNAREITGDDFFDGMFTTALEEGEIIVEVKFPVPIRSAYAKFIQPASRFPLVAVFAAAFADGVRVAVTGASAEGVFRWSEAEAALADGFTSDALDGLAVPEGEMIDDLHGSAEYRAHLVKVMAGRAVAEAR